MFWGENVKPRKRTVENVAGMTTQRKRQKNKYGLCLMKRGLFHLLKENMVEMNMEAEFS